MEWEVGIEMTVGTTVTVEADSEEEARREALDVVSYSDFDMDNADYTTYEWKRAEHDVCAVAHPVAE